MLDYCPDKYFMTDKQIDTIVEILAKHYNKSFSETLRELCKKAHIEFKLNLSTQEKREIIKNSLEDIKSVLPEEKIKEIEIWIEEKRKRK